MAALRILLVCVVAACLYGIAQDQVTVRVCLEYFTIGHPPVFRTTCPTLLALGWGVWATWWVGVLLGLPLAAAARIGPRPRLDARDLLRPLALLLAAIAICALAAGWWGWSWASRRGPAALVHFVPDRVPEAARVAYFANRCAHVAAYAAGFGGGLLLCASTWRRRRRLAMAP